VNGQDTSTRDQTDQLQPIANETGAEVIGIHNSTDGGWNDTVESGQGKLAGLESAPVKTLSDNIVADLDAGKPVHVFSHSEGALITSQALGEVHDALQRRGLSEDQIRDTLSRVQVETFGGAATTYPVDGPQYRHYVNDDDLVGQLTGQGPIGHEVFGADPGQNGQVVVNPGDGPFLGVEDHGLIDHYLPRRPDGGF